MPNSADEHSPLIPGIGQNHSSNTMSNSSTSTTWLRVGATYGALAVGLGAFGAHGLKKHITEPHRIANWGTAAQYQLIHAVACIIARDNPLAAGLFTAGMTMFSGSLYALTLDPARFRWLGPVTPLGGLCFIGGWIALGFSGSRPRL